MPFWKSIFPVLSLILLLGCNNHRFDDFNPDLIDPISAARLEYYAQDSTLAEILQIPKDYARLDSLIYIANWLKNYNHNVSLKYIQQAYDLATLRNWEIPRAISSYISAARKEERARYNEDLEDALVDIYISKRTFDAKPKQDWQSRVNNLLGTIHFRKGNIDSAFYYLDQALQILEKQKNLNEAQQIRKAAILQDKAATLRLSHNETITHFESSDSIFQLLEEEKFRARLWHDLGVYYQKLAFARKNDPLTEKIKEAFPNKEADFIREQRAIWSVAADSLFDSTIKYGFDSKDTDMLALGFQRKGYLAYLNFYKTDDRKYFQNANAYLDSSLQYTTGRNLARLYEIKSLNYYNEWFLSRDTTTADSVMLNYRKAITAAKKEGALRIINSVSKNLLSFYNYNGVGIERAERALQQHPVRFVGNSYRTFTDTISNRSKAAYKRINKVEKLELVIAAQRKQRNLRWIGGAILVIASLIFLLIIQFFRQRQLKAKLDALRAQINPHFISNSLNAIENLVNQNKNREASKYLIHFSRLSRKILSGSRNANISLKEELDTLKHFIELEKLRFSNKLDYEMIVDEEVDPEDYQVPAMILQPYVENAIWHGIKPKKTRGNIIIEIEKEENFLVCIIEDDGIGRVKAAEQNVGVVLNRKSYGMQITQERLKSIGKYKSATVTITDLYDENKAAAGTKVTIKLPIVLMNSSA